MLLTQVTLGVGWEPEVGVGESRGKEESQENRKEREECTGFYTYTQNCVCVCIRTKKVNRKFKNHKISSFVE